MELLLHIKDPILRCYFVGRFPRQDDGYCLVDSRSLTGMAITSLVSHADRILPSAPDPDDSAVAIRLSRSKYSDPHRGKALFLTPHAEAQINATLKREFDNDFTAFCSTARVCGFQVKDAIEAFIHEYGMETLFRGDIETLKKKFYRYEVSTRTQLHETLRQKANYAVRKVRRIMNKVAL